MAIKQAEQKEINVEQVVRYLSYTFAKAMQNVRQAPKRTIDPNTKKVVKTDAYLFQTDFCYLIDEIQRGPKCMVQKAISECNELIERVATHNTTDSSEA